MSVRIGVIGAGPRGTSVVERLCANASETDTRVIVHVFDPAPAGPGSVWRPHQSPELLMNTVACQVSVFTDGSVPCAGPLVPGPSLYGWARRLRGREFTGPYPPDVLAEAARLGPDDYPTRAFYGHYLTWVMRWLRDNRPANLDLHLHSAEVVALEDGADGRQVVRLADGTRFDGFDRVVLALGHGPLAESAEERVNRGFARRHGLGYVGPGNPADADLSPFEPGQPVAVRGLGLCFFDYLALLTTGRGGEFTDRDGTLVYQPSGQEPVLYAGSRRGIPYHARGENQKGAHGRHLPRFLTEGVIARWRELADAGAPVGFLDRVWPLIDREVRTVYYETLIAALAGPVAAAEFVARSLAGVPEAELLREYEISPRQRWDWARIERPYAGQVFGGTEDFQRWLIEYLRADVHQAGLGNLHGPHKAALDALRDLRNEVRLVVDHGGIHGDSYRDELVGWYNPLNAFTSIGPPARRIAELIALIEAGVVRVLGPGTRITRSGTGHTFLASATMVPGAPVTVRGLIEARLPEPDLRRSTNPLLRQLYDAGQAVPYRMGGYECGGLAVTPRPYRVIDRAGRAHPARFAFGVPTEGVHWVTAAGIRPGVGSVTLADTDAIARAALGVAVATPQPAIR